MYKHFFKRLFDLIIALFALPFVLLLILIMVPLIWLTDRGPTFYNAQRVGLNGKIFKMFKFRSMKVNDVADSKQAMLMVLVKQNLGIYFFVLILINFPSLSMCLKVVC